MNAKKDVQVKLVLQVHWTASTPTTISQDLSTDFTKVMTVMLT